MRKGGFDMGRLVIDALLRDPDSNSYYCPECGDHMAQAEYLQDGMCFSCADQLWTTIFEDLDGE